MTADLGQVLLPLSLFMIMLGVGMSLELRAFSLLWRTPLTVFAAVAAQLILLPSLGFLVVTLFQLPSVLAMGIIILTLAPGGATSNMITYLCRGDTALSVCITAIVGLITPFTMPLFAMLALQYWFAEQTHVELPVVATVVKLFVIAVVPVILGALIHHKWPLFCQRSEKSVKILACTFLVVVVFGIVKANWLVLPGMITQIGPAVLCLVTLAMLTGFSVAKVLGLNTQQQLTYAIEIGIQNAAIALIITSSVLQNSEMSASVLIYGVLMNIPAFILISWRIRLIAQTAR